MQSSYKIPLNCQSSEVLQILSISSKNTPSQRRKQFYSNALRHFYVPFVRHTDAFLSSTRLVRVSCLACVFRSRSRTVCSHGSRNSARSLSSGRDCCRTMTAVPSWSNPRGALHSGWNAEGHRVNYRAVALEHQALIHQARKYYDSWDRARAAARV